MFKQLIAFAESNQALIAMKITAALPLYLDAAVVPIWVNRGAGDPPRKSDWPIYASQAALCMISSKNARSVVGLMV